MLKSLTGRLALAASLSLAASGAMAAAIALDTSDPTNGLTDIYSATFDGALVPCGGSSPSYCSFFGGDPSAVRNILISPNPTGVDNGVPVGIAPVPVAGSFLDVSLGAGNTTATILGGVVSVPPISLIIQGTTTVNAAGAGFVITGLGSGTTAAVNGSGQVEFLVNNSPGLAADFTTLSSAVTGCTGPLCALIGILSLDMVKYRLFLDFDPTFTSFTGEFIGQTSNNSLVYATLNSVPSVIPVPAAVWFMASGLGLLAGLRRKSQAA